MSLKYSYIGYSELRILQRMVMCRVVRGLCT